MAQEDPDSNLAIQASSMKADTGTQLVVSLFPSSSDGLGQIALCDLFSTGEIPGGDLGVNFDP